MRLPDPESPLTLLAWSETPSLAQEPENHEPTDAQVKLVGLSVSKLPPTLGLNLSGHKSTSVTLLVTAPRAAMVGLDDLQTQLNHFRDDHDTNLIAWNNPPDGFDPDPYRVDLLALGADTHTALIEITAHEPPSLKARSISLEGEFFLKTGVGLKTVEQKDLVLKTGESIHVGPKPMDLNLDEPPLDDLNRQNLGRTFVNFEGDPSHLFPPREPALLEKIKELIFLDNTGRPIASRREQLYNETRDHEQNFLTYSVDRKPGDRVTVRVVYYDHLETLRIPFRLKTGLGLEAEPEHAP